MPNVVRDASWAGLVLRRHWQRFQSAVQDIDRFKALVNSACVTAGEEGESGKNGLRAVRSPWYGYFIV
jgi:hypothetical protein